MLVVEDFPRLVRGLMASRGWRLEATENQIS